MTAFVTINHINFLNNMFEVGKWERETCCFVNLTAINRIKGKGENTGHFYWWGNRTYARQI